MKIILIGNPNSKAVDRLTAEAKKMNIEFSAVSLHSLILEVTNDTFSLRDTHNNDLLTNDCFIFRGIGDATQEVMVIAKYLEQHQKIVIEEKCAHGAVMMDKLALQAIGHDVPTPDYYLIQGKEGLDKITDSLTYPVVVKSTVGSMGKNVALAEDKEALTKLYESHGPQMIVQDYLKVSSDVRAIVIGGQYVGAYKRTRGDGEFRMNRPGNTKEPINLTSEAAGLAERAATAQNIEVAGVDLVEHDDQWYVIEINVSPQFNKFEECTGINIAQKILEYAVAKCQ